MCVGLSAGALGLGQGIASKLPTTAGKYSTGRWIGQRAGVCNLMGCWPTNVIILGIV